MDKQRLIKKKKKKKKEAAMILFITKYALFYITSVFPCMCKVIEPHCLGILHRLAGISGLVWVLKRRRSNKNTKLLEKKKLWHRMKPRSPL